MKVLAVGDIHVKQSIIDKVEKLESNYDKIVFVGDYCDDFRANPEDVVSLLERLHNLQNNDKYIFLLGNHDYAYRNYHEFSSIEKYYGIQSGYSQITQLAIGNSNKAQDFLKNLKLFEVIDNVWYSHAGLTSAFNEKDISHNSLWKNDSIIWARPNEGLIYKNVKQVIGHTPVKKICEFEPNIYCIDTFSTFRDGSQIGDETCLEIINGEQFNVVNFK